METADRIRLCEAMGWTNFINDQVGLPPGAKHKSPATQGHQFPPDPFTDANDDYAVLEWVRPEDAVYSKPIMGPKHEAWRDFIFELRLLQAKRSKASDAIFESYEIGDYARAALKLINDE